nr:hypothetical transcript [Hymenolepis microstoma]
MERICPNRTFYIQAYHRELSQSALFPTSSSMTWLNWYEQCLLYADDLVLWHSAPKKNIQKRMEIALTYALKRLANWWYNNGMVINTSKTACQTFLLAHHSINPHLIYKHTPLKQTNESTYLGVTFDTKLTWKNHIAKIAERASNRLNVLKRLAGGSLWGSARSTLNTTYKMFGQPIILYCCETLDTAP